MSSNSLFLNSIANRISLGLKLEELYMLNLYFDIINYVLVFFLYVSDMLCSYMLSGKIPYSYTLGYGYLRLRIRVWDYLRLLVWLIGNPRLTFLC